VRLAKGHARECNYGINGHPYTKGYYLADGIYLKWSKFVKAIHNPYTEKNSWFDKYHEGCRKDFE
jgi:hypothetical protein